MSDSKIDFPDRKPLRRPCSDQGCEATMFFFVGSHRNGGHNKIYNVRPPRYVCWFISPSNYSYKMLSADPGRRKGERVRAERLSNTNTNTKLLRRRLLLLLVLLLLQLLLLLLLLLLLPLLLLLLQSHGVFRAGSRQLIFSTLFYCEQPQAIESLNGCFSRISDGTFRPPGNLLLRRILGHFRHEIRWCFAVSAAFGKDVWLLLSCSFTGSSSSQN